MIASQIDAVKADPYNGTFDQPLTATWNKKWGFLPPLIAIMGFGVLILAIANTAARFELPWAKAALWLGLLVLYVPTSIRLAWPEVHRNEQIGLVVALSLALYMAKIMHSPAMFTLNDEFAHSRTAIDILSTQHLFAYNPIQPAKAYYPGLEIVATSIVALGGLSLFDAGLIVVGAARVIQTLAMHLMWERLSGSARIAAVASVVYATHPNYLFWTSQFGYESLALGLVALVLLAVTSRMSLASRNRSAFRAVTLVSMSALIVTHHLTSYALIALLVLLALLAWIWRKMGRSISKGYGWMAVCMLVGTVAWLQYFAYPTGSYLLPVLSKAAQDFWALLSGANAGRQLFRTATGQASPILEQLLGFASVGLILLALPIGLIKVWQRHRHKSEAFGLALLAVLYPVTLGMRLTRLAVETAQRSSEFIFVGLAFVLAVGLVEFWLHKGARWWRYMIYGIWVAVVFAGGILIGVAPWALMPWPHDPSLIASDTRGLQPQSWTLADWAHYELGPNNTFIADRTNFFLLGSTGQQRVVTGLSWIFFSPQLGQAEFSALARKQVQYVVVDQALSTSLPRLGTYFESGEPDAFQHTMPLDNTLLGKFDDSEATSRLYDDGRMVLFKLNLPDPN